MSDSSHERSPRFTRAIVGRLIAVLLFVALGTFAVIHIMGESETPETSAQAQLDAQGSSDDAQPSLDSNSENSEPTKDPTETSAFQQPKTPSPNDDANDGKSFSPPKSFGGNGLGTNSGSNAFDAAPANQIGIASKTSSPTIKAAKPASGSQPPARFAQLPNQGIPIIGNNNGFGSQEKSAAAQSGDAVQNVAQRAKSTAQQFGENVENKANDLLNDAKQSADKSVNKLLDATDQKIDRPNFSLSAGNGFKSAPPPAGNNLQSNLPEITSNPAPTMKSPTPQPSQNFNGKPNLSVPKTAAPSNAATTELRPRTGNLSPLQRPAQTNTDQEFGSSFGNATQEKSKAASPNSTGPDPSTAPERLTPPNFSAPAASTPQQNPFSSRPKAPATTPPAGNNNPNPFDRPSLRQKTEASPTPNQASQPLSSFPAPPNTDSTLNRPTSRLASPSALVPQDNSVTPPASTLSVPGDRQLEGIQAPSLTVQKLSPREIQVNEPAEFVIVVRNIGRVIAEGVTVHDQVPDKTDFQGSTPQPTHSSADRKLSWEIGSLRPGQEKRISMMLKPTQPGEIGSVAQVTFATKASMRTLVTKPVISITHQAKPTVLIGENVIFDVVVQNKGDGPAKNVIIQEDVPSQLDFPDAGLDSGNRGLEYEIGTLMPGQSKRVQLGLKAARTGKLRNVIEASASGGLRAQHAIDMEVIAPSLIVESEGPTRRFLQREVTHQFKIFNKGTANATNVDLIARLPAGLRYVRANNRGKYDANSHAVYWSLVEIDTTSSAAVELSTMPVDTGDQDIRFEARADLNQQTATVQKLAVEHLVDVFFDIDDVVDPIEIGSETSYRIRVVNQGTKAATNVQLQVDFPNGLAPTAVEGNLQNQIQGQRVAFAPISSVAPGDQVQFIIRATGQSAGDHRVTVSAKADGRQTPVSKEESTRVYADR